MLNSLGLSFIMARFFDLRVGGSSCIFSETKYNQIKTIRKMQVLPAGGSKNMP